MPPWPKFPNLRLNLPLNHLSMISSLLLLQFIFFIDVKAQSLSDSTEGIPSQDSVSNFQPSLAVVIGMLAIMFSLTFILLLYAKFCHRASSVHNMSQQIQDGLVRSRSHASGVDKTVVESLPFFRFCSLKGSREGLECSVCLAKFEDVEILRLLPKCKHAFHINCIDQWLEKHSTCPLCRRKVSADDLSQLPYSSSLRFLWNQSELREESNLELYVQREDNRHGSSRFSIGSSFRKTDGGIKEEELPIQHSMDSDDEHNKPLHKFNHKIVVSDVVLKNRWSNVSSSDLMFLNSELLNDVSSARFSSLDSRDEQKSMETRENDEMMNIKEEMERKRIFESKLREIKQSDHYSVGFPGLPTTSGSKEQNPGFESKALNPNDKRSKSEIVVHPRFTELRNKDSSLAETNVKEERMRRLWLPIARKTVQWFANRERRHPQSQGLNLQTLNV
ncbi:hypothetical protein Pfo_000406 [Paulownia fortunei]|nr:hypothetical protein Pfo_000406 [Paulownia fortunei]